MRRCVLERSFLNAYAFTLAILSRFMRIVARFD